MKKLICVLLVALFVVSTITSTSAYSVWSTTDPDIEVQTKTADEAIAEYEAKSGATVDTNRYYFQMPDGLHGKRGSDGKVAPTWYNEYSEGAGVYWWGSAPAACDAWAGYRAMIDDAEQHIYYVNMPRQAVCFVWNNGVDDTSHYNDSIYNKAAQTVDVPCEYPDPGEYATMPEGANSFNECIYIIDPSKTILNSDTGRQICTGTWYFYYGDGCYGEYAQTSGRFDSVDTNCCNPDHFDEYGNHKSITPTEVQTEIPTEAPVTESPATEAPATEAPIIQTGDIYIRTGDKLYPASTGDTYTYEYRLNLGKKLTAIDASLTYDTTGLELLDYSFPILGSSANAGTYNGKVYFNYASAYGIEFSSDSSVLVRATFKVKAGSGTFDVHTDITDMSRYQEVKIVENGIVQTNFTHKELITDDDSTTSIYIRTGDKYYKVKRGKSYNYICYLKTDELVGNLVANTSYDSYGLSTSSSTRTSYQSYSGKSFKADNTVLTSIPFKVSDYAYDNYTFNIATSISKLLDINEDIISSYSITEVIDGLSYVTYDPNSPPTEPEPTEAPTEPEPETTAPTEPEPTEAPTDPPTEPPTEAPTLPPTEVPTEEPTEPPTELPTEPATEAPTECDHWYWNTYSLFR